MDGSLREPGLLPITYGNNMRCGLCARPWNQGHRGIQLELRGLYHGMGAGTKLIDGA